MKKILILLSVISLALVLTFSVSAKTGNTENETTKIIDGVVYKLKSDIDKSKYDLSDTKDIFKITEEIIYPETYGNISIADSAFDGSTVLQSVTFPEKCGKITDRKSVV